MKKLLFLLLPAFLMNIGWSQTMTNGSISHTSGTRTYTIYVPAAYSAGTPVPLVFNLHGYGSNNAQQIVYGDFRPIADTANFLIVAPQGLNDNTGTAHWNANWGTGVDDIGFISALIDSLSAIYSIDQDRIYSTGMSNGGFMSLTLAGQLSNKIAAVASVTGTMSVLQVPANTVSRPMPVMQIHGTADPTVNYNGDQYFLSVDSVLNYWVAHNNCNTTPVITAVPNTNTGDGCTAERISFLGGDNGSEVVHYKVTNGAHTWPGSAFTIGVTNQDFSASVEIWKFFSRYTKSSLVSVVEYGSQDWVKLLSNNPTSGPLLFEFESKEAIDIKVYSANGQLVLAKKSMGTENFDLTSMTNGLYIFTFSNGKGQQTSYKVMKN